MGTPMAVALLTVLLLGLVGYTFLVPKGTATMTSGEGDEERSGMLGAVAAVSNEVYAALPAGVDPKKLTSRPSEKLESLIVRSGNPWKVSLEEFRMLSFVGGAGGALAGGALWFFAKGMVSLPVYVFIAAGGLLGYFIPRLKYRDTAKQRDLDFKRQLPEALDLLVISMSGGRTFVNALRAIMPNMQDGVLKDEFLSLLSSVDAGNTLTDALDAFSGRAPSESVRTFVESIKTALEVNSPLIETLEARAEASRVEFFALIHEKTAQLDSKISMVLTPTLIPAICIIVIAPSLEQLPQILAS